MPLPSGLPDQVADEESVARHVFTDRHIGSDAKDRNKKWAKAQAFLPLFDGHNWVFSVSRTLHLKDAEAILRNGRDIGQLSGRSYKGSALLTAKQVRSTAMKSGEGGELQKLDVLAHEAADGSTPYHAHVTGFLPLPDGANMKEYFKEASMDLERHAKEQTFVVPAPPQEETGM